MANYQTPRHRASVLKNAASASASASTSTWDEAFKSTVGNLSHMRKSPTTAVDFEDSLTSKPFVFVVGHEKKEFHIHKQIIGRLSPALDTLVNGGMKEAQEGRVHWPDVTTDTFVRFASFAYSGDYTAANPSVATPDGNGGEDPTYSRAFDGPAASAAVTAAAAAAAAPGSGKSVLNSAGGPSAASASTAPVPVSHPSHHHHPYVHVLSPLTSDSSDGDSESLSDLSSEYSSSSFPRPRGPLVYSESPDAAISVHNGSNNPTVGNAPVASRARARPQAQAQAQAMEPPTPPYSILSWMDQFGQGVYLRFNSRSRSKTEAVKLGKRRSHVSDTDADDSDDHGSEDSDLDQAEEEQEDTHRYRRHLLRTGQRRSHGQHKPDFPSGRKQNWTADHRAKSKFSAMSRFLTSVSPQEQSSRGAALNTQDSRNISQLPVLLSHASLYILADTYGIDPLRQLSLRRLHDCLLRHNVAIAQVPDLASLTHTIFDNTVADDKARTVLVYFWSCFLEHVSSAYDFKELVRSQGDFAASLVESTSLRLQITARPTCGCHYHH